MSSAPSKPKLSRDEYKKQKELEEARKAGTAAPDLDEDGNMINPHIPKYLSDAPWYLHQSHAGLKHQKKQKERLRSDVNKDEEVWFVFIYIYVLMY